MAVSALLGLLEQISEVVMHKVVPVGMMECPSYECELLIRKPGKGEIVICLCGETIEGDRTVSKSVLDNVPVKDKAFPLKKSSTFLEIVSTCPHCGSPVYGQKMVPADVQPEVLHSCKCNEKRLTFEETVVTK